MLRGWNNLTMLALAVLAVMLIVPAGTFAATDVVNVALDASPTTPDPHWSTQTSSRIIAAHVFECLVTTGENYEVIPQLATGWTSSEDGRVWRFYLRKGVRFHNGKEMTADDVKASVERFMAVSPRKGDLSFVDRIEVAGPYEVDFYLKEAAGTFLEALANPHVLVAIMPAEIARAKANEELKPSEVIGTGPYKLVQYYPDVRIQLERFEGYTPDTSRPMSGLGGEKRAIFKTVNFLPVREPAARLAGLEGGLYDFAQGIPIANYGTILAKKGIIEPEIVKPQWGIYLEINHAEYPTNNVKFRQALMAALDMKAIMEVVTGGNEAFYRVQPSVFFPEQTAWYTPAGGEVYNRPDLEKVKRLLKESGYRGEPIVILSNQSYDWMYRTTLAVFQQLRAAGINAKLEFSDWATQLAKARSLKGWHLNQTGWSLRFSPAALGVSLVTGGGNAYGYSNPRMDSLFARLARELDPAKRKAIYEEIQRLIYTDIPILRIGDYFGLDARRSDLVGYKSWYVIPRMWNVSRK